MATDVQLLKKIATDVETIKDCIAVIETSLQEIDYDIHTIKPAYLQKLKRIAKEGTISQKDFEKKFGVKL